MEVESSERAVIVKRVKTAIPSDSTDPPPSFPRALQATNPTSFALLPFRLALPRTTFQSQSELVNDVQKRLHLERFGHLSDLLGGADGESDGDDVDVDGHHDSDAKEGNEGELAALLIEFVAECIRCSGSGMRDEVLQNGVIHALMNVLRKVLISP